MVQTRPAACPWRSTACSHFQSFYSTNSLQTMWITAGMAVNFLLFQVGNRVALLCAHTDVTFPGFSGHNLKLMNDTAPGAKPGQGRISRDSATCNRHCRVCTAPHTGQCSSCSRGCGCTGGAGTLLATAPLLLGLPCPHLQYPSQEAFNLSLVVEKRSFGRPN